MKKLIISLFAMALIGCATATVDVPVCDDNDVGTIPASPISGVSIPPVSFKVPLDLSKTIGKVDDVSNEISVAINQMLLNGDSSLQWITQVDVSIAGDVMPDAPLASYKSDGTDPGKSLSMTVIMTPDVAINYLRTPATLTFTIAGMAQTHTVSLTNTLCVQATGSVRKSL